MGVLRYPGLAVLAVVTTILSLRLLGGRRGWVTGLVAAVIGWGAAVLVALGINDWEWGADGLAVHLVAIGIPATMAAAVILDLLARPGTLAFGERAGLVVTPRPMRAIRRRISVLRRYRELVRLCRQQGFGPFLSTADRAERTVDPPGVRLRRVLEQAGGVYIKLGQIAATRVDLLPPDVCRDLADLQNRVPAESQERIAQVLEAELGTAVDEVFAEFDWQPLAAASIGQTYKARLQSGESVVVKVQRPDIEAMMERDLAALALLANMAQRRTPFGQGLRSGELLAQFAKGLLTELDFRHEADAMREMAALMREHSTVRIPAVYGDLSTRRVLVQERFEGVTVSDIGRLPETTVDRQALADVLLRATLDQIIRIGVFHADPHPGNVFVLAGGGLGLIDFGAVGRLDPIEQAAIVDIMIALARRDVSLLRDGVERVAQFSGTTSPDELERAIARLLADHVRPGASVDPAVFEELVATLSRFGMRLPTDVVLLSRALVTVDGTLPRPGPRPGARRCGDGARRPQRGPTRGRPQGAGARRAPGNAPPPPPLARAGRPHPHPDRTRRAARAQHPRRGRRADCAHAGQPPPAHLRRDGVPRHVRLAARLDGRGAPDRRADRAVRGVRLRRPAPRRRARPEGGCRRRQGRYDMTLERSPLDAAARRRARGGAGGSPIR